MRVTSLHTYPVKGCHRLDHDEARVEPWGLAGDRRWMVVDADGVGMTQRRDPRLVTLRPAPAPDGGLTLRAAGLPDLPVAPPHDGDKTQVRVFSGKPLVPARLAPAEAHAWFGALLDAPVRLAWLADPATARPVNPDFGSDDDRVSFADGYPILVTTMASLDAVNGWLVEGGDEPVPMNRFRPNIVVSGATPWAEDDWLGGRLRVGDVTLRVAKPCDRCLVTTTDQETGERGRQPLHVLGKYRKSPMGLLFGVNVIPDGPGIIHVGDPVLSVP
ncbi:MOSC domain-containing protein [Spirilliplanes yamanashiensis]|uniref:Molybdenum cofactor biosysynthesis protein n=1 Tax=Spirilliplanes yamanashiensis TaxID=42233 RepID=A0A8J3YCX0_9ACTN|nr:MOSC N-terminal beta barrel domain-containing protein [Spirilliplanes yamanashiensis]MDP9816253.1 uncharacterized protein YcbX [Spirilliplanes yamanashiensis]GIJ05779.1 molybdenum cofactor biosysynthesis protein [Spirilliplanes yamanashiensis]